MCKLLPLFPGLSGYVNHLNSQIQHDMFLLVSTPLDGIKFVWCNSICYTIRVDMPWSQRTESILFQSSESLFLLLLCCFIIPQATYKLCSCFLPPLTFQTFCLSFTERRSFAKLSSGNLYSKACIEWAGTHVLVLGKKTCYSFSNLIPERRLIDLTTVIDEGPYFCLIYNSTFCCCFRPTYCLCWSISSCRKPKVYISSWLKSPHIAL